MPRDFRNLAQALGQFHSDLDVEAGKLFDKMDGVRERGSLAFKKAHGRLEGAKADLDAVEKLVVELEKTNAGPSGGSPPPPPVTK